MRRLADLIAQNAERIAVVETTDNGKLKRRPRLARSRRVTVPTHYACIAPGGPFAHRMLVSGRRRGLRIVSWSASRSTAGRWRAATAAPYRIVSTVPFAAGTRHVAEARVTYRLRGRVHHTSVGRAIVMCP